MILSWSYCYYTYLLPFIHLWLRTMVGNKNTCHSVLWGGCADQDTHLHRLTETYLKQMYQTLPKCHADTLSCLLINASIICSQQKKEKKKLWQIYINVFSMLASRRVLSPNGSEEKMKGSSISSSWSAESHNSHTPALKANGKAQHLKKAASLSTKDKGANVMEMIFQVTAHLC